MSDARSRLDEMGPDPSELITTACYRTLCKRKMPESEAFALAKDLCAEVLFNLGGRDTYVPKTPVWHRFRTEAQVDGIRRAAYEHGPSAAARALGLSRTTLYRLIGEQRRYRTGQMDPEERERYEVRMAKLAWMADYPDVDETDGLPLFADQRRAEAILKTREQKAGAA